MKHRYFLFVIIMIVFLGLNCGCKPNSVDDNESYVLPVPTKTKNNPIELPSLTPTQVPTKSPTDVKITVTPIPTEIDFNSDLIDQGYRMLESSSVSGPGNYTYSASLFIDSSFSAVVKPDDDQNTFNTLPARDVSFAELETLEGCKLAFSYSDGQYNELLGVFPAPKYPEGSYYHHYPITCTPASWNITPDNELYKALGFNGDWSDINQNGLPEFVVHYQYCSNACVKAVVSAHFYEIQSPSSVVDITADLPGVMEPFGMLHSESPMSFYVYDPTLWYSKWAIIDTWWIYAWDGEKLVDVTANYADEYINQGEEIAASIQAKYGDTFYEWELLSILFLYEKAGLRELAIDTFLDLTQPSNWPQATSDEVCWLQIARATAVDDHKNGRPFQFPPIQLAVAPADLQHQFANNFDPNFDVLDYDISACGEFMP